MFSALMSWELRSLYHRPHAQILIVVLLLPVLFPTGFWFGSPFIMPLYICSLAIGYRLIRPLSDGQAPDEEHYLLSRPVLRQSWFLARLAGALSAALALWVLLIPYSFLVRGLIHAWFVRYFGDKLDPPNMLDTFYRTGTGGWNWAWLISLVFCAVGCAMALLRQVQGRRKSAWSEMLDVWSPPILIMGALLWRWFRQYGSAAEVSKSLLSPDEPGLILTLGLGLLYGYLALGLKRLKTWDQGS